MSLENALERWEGWELGDPFDVSTLDVILEAARKWANPDLEGIMDAYKGAADDVDTVLGHGAVMLGVLQEYFDPQQAVPAEHRGIS